MGTRSGRRALTRINLTKSDWQATLGNLPMTISCLRASLAATQARTNFLRGTEMIDLALSLVGHPCSRPACRRKGKASAAAPRGKDAAGAAGLSPKGEGKRSRKLRNLRPAGSRACNCTRVNRTAQRSPRKSKHETEYCKQQQRARYRGACHT